MEKLVTIRALWRVDNFRKLIDYGRRKLEIEQFLGTKLEDIAALEVADGHPGYYIAIARNKLYGIMRAGTQLSSFVTGNYVYLDDRLYSPAYLRNELDRYGTLHCNQIKFVMKPILLPHELEFHPKRGKNE